jgi:hypothetical protein
MSTVHMHGDGAAGVYCATRRAWQQSRDDGRCKGGGEGVALVDPARGLEAEALAGVAAACRYTSEEGAHRSSAKSLLAAGCTR